MSERETTRMRRWMRPALRWLGPALLVVVILRLDDPRAVVRTFAASSSGLLAAALLFNAATIWLKVIRWQIILRVRGIRYPHGRAWLAFLASAYIAMLTPGRVGDLLRIQYLKHEAAAPYPDGLASVVMDRLCDLYVLAAFVAMAALRYAPWIAGELAFLTWAGVALTVLGPLFLLVPGLAERSMTAAYRRVSRDPDARGLSAFLAGLRAQVGRPLFVTLPLTVAGFAVTYAQGWLVARAMGLPLSPVDVVCLLAIANLLSLLPVSISGVGLREAFFAVVFPALALSAEDGVAYGLAVFTVTYVSMSLMGLVAWQLAPPPTAADRG
jgi:uncharacterized protein (TIRG00374 family)